MTKHIIKTPYGTVETSYNEDEDICTSFGFHKPTQPKKPPISIGGGIGEQRGENKRMLFTLN